jgi:N-acetylglucosamine-6-phosphate deacetylase
MKKENELGSIAKDKKANMVVLDDAFNVLEMVTSY